MAEDSANGPQAQHLNGVTDPRSSTMLAVRMWRLCWSRRAAGVAAVAIVAAVLASGCEAPAPPPTEKEVVVWKRLGEWSGRGNIQTESVVGLTGSLRMHWQTKNEAPEGTGTFRLVLQSAISGRDLQEPVNHAGAGEGTAYVADDPRVFHFLVESSNLDWSFTVEEAMFGRAAAKP